ncbi:MAG TPA: glutamine-hydrolyzing GMP synthase [Paracoccaceae bacterium]|nr:glutamine-hydrolyzing GMP synthase [Paracoccaceae bacterium]
MSSEHEICLIVDFGSPLAQMVARRLRESHIYCEIHPFDRVDGKLLQRIRPRAIILSDGPAAIEAADAPRADEAIFAAGVPVLGIGYGQMLMVEQLGGKVTKGAAATAPGLERLSPAGPSELLQGIATSGGSIEVWTDRAGGEMQLPDGFSVQATAPDSPHALIADGERRFYGLMFHPESAHTPEGTAILHNFTHRIADFSGDWTMRAYKDHAIAAIREQVGSERVICGLSGGVDSSVAAVLIHEAIGDQLTCVFVDTGLMRAGEAEEVITLFRDHYNIPLVHADEADRFLTALAGVTDPEEKRKTIGRLFIEVFEAHAAEAGGAAFLAQGTLYPDVIESVAVAGGPAVKIKSHHNVGGLPERMRMQLVEPLRELFKDEVRMLGRELGLPESFIGRHPFPGPGLAVRCPGEVTREKLDILRAADAIYLDEIRKAGLYDEIWQAFAVLLPVQTVGVTGDERTYDFACALRAVISVDGMTADYYPFAHDFLRQVTARIIGEVRGINRVVYDVTGKPPGTIEWE